MRTRRVGFARLALATSAILASALGVAASGAGATTRSAVSSNASCQGSVTPGPTRVGRFLGVLPSAGGGGRVSCAFSNVSGASGAKAYYGAPPLIDHGGPVMGTVTQPGALTVTPIFWDPGSTLSPSYERVIDGYFSNVAAASGQLTNVYSAELQYGIGYQVTAGTAVVDTDPFPANGCTPDSGAVYADDSGYNSCLTDSQLTSEIESVTSADALPVDFANLYEIFLPKGVESCFTSADGQERGFCTINSDARNGFCGYHSSISDGPSTLLYADLAFPIYNSPTGYTCSSEYAVGLESPNAELDADVMLNVTTHETIEATTDPLGTTWFDRRGDEIGDDCNFLFGGDLGGSPGALYNQTINGDHYLLQQMLSNQDYAASKKTACIQRVDLPIGAFKVKPSRPKAGRTVTFDAAKSHGATGFSWNFGDGSPVATGDITTHVYAAAGTYDVTLTVTDDVGLQSTSGTLTETVAVNPS